MTVALTLFDSFLKNLSGASLNLGSNTFKAILSNTSIAGTEEAISDVTQIANGNGYTTGGVTLTTVTYTASGDTYVFTSDLFSWTSASSGMATFRYGVLTDTTISKVVGWWDHGSGVSLAVGAKYQVTPNASGLFVVSRSP